jgi:hypothetical protein
VTGLSVADIDRWKPGDVREVFHAARNRAEANQFARDGLATLPAFQSWGGVAADAAKNAVEQTRKDLDKDGREALAVAMAADRAADGIEAVQAKLQALRDALGAGLTADQVAIDAGQEKNQRDAFRQVYGRDPLSANDWRMAEGLDPHTYDPRFRGTESNVVVGRFTPIPGAGVYRQNMYIPGPEVQNIELNQRGLPHMVGDNRGPSPFAPAEASRVSLFVDMEHGIVVARQNPTMSTDRVDAGTGIPKVNAIQGDNGALMISYTAADPFEPGPAKPIINVNGTMNIVPTGNGNIAVGGDITQYPSTEGYQYKPDGTTTQLFNRQVTSDQTGAAIGLLLPNTHIGASLPDLPQPWVSPTPAGPPGSPQLIPTERLPMTYLGPASNPPVIQTVPLPPPPPVSVAAPPLPVPTPPPLPAPTP